MTPESDSTLAPLPPAPIRQSTGAPSQHRELVGYLTQIGQDFGATIPVRVLPGNIPMLHVPPEKLYAVAQHLRDNLGFALLSCVSGVDMGDHREVVYHLRNVEQHWLMELKVQVPPANEVDSLVGLYSGADALERETFDLYGIVFNGHPDLRRILLDDEFVGFPLLKSFRQTPMAVHDKATTQIAPELAVTAETQKGTGDQRAPITNLTQGTQERLHPGTPTLGSTQFHGRSFPPQTWKHQPDYHDGDQPAEDEKK